jgi:hypothetical protein
MEYLTRRQAMQGVSGYIATTAITGPAWALPPVAWIGGIAIGLVSNAAYDLIKNSWGLQDWSKPPADLSNSVRAPHAEAIKPLQQQGFDVTPTLSGSYSGGNIEISRATRGDQFKLLSTANHDDRVCTTDSDKTDTLALSILGKTLRDRGLAPDDVQGLTLPIHPKADARYSGNRRFSPTYMTPSNGTISWSTDCLSMRPNFAATIRSGPVDTSFRFAQEDNGRWVFDMNTARG